MNHDDLLATHRALLEGDPSASRRLYHACCNPLYQLLKKRHPLADEDDIHDSVVDAILDVITKPQGYEAAKGSLSNYLYQIGVRRLIDRIRKNYAYIKMTAGLVAEGCLDANNAWEDAEWKRVEEDPHSSARVDTFLAEALPDPKDRKLWALLSDGRVSTDEAARILEVEHLSPQELQQVCKRNLDRIRKAVTRLFWRKLLPDAKDRALWTITRRSAQDLPVAECARILGVVNEPEVERERIVRERIAAVKATVSERRQELWRHL